MSACLFLHDSAGARYTSAGTIPGYIEAISPCCRQDVWLSLLIDVVYGEEGEGVGEGEGQVGGVRPRGKEGKDWEGKEEDEKDSWHQFEGSGGEGERHGKKKKKSTNFFFFLSGV